jgi:hypothetical protein
VQAGAKPCGRRISTLDKKLMAKNVFLPLLYRFWTAKVKLILLFFAQYCIFVQKNHYNKKGLTKLPSLFFVYN